MTKDKWHGHIAIFAANILFGINIPIAKTLMPEWIDPVGLTFLRMSFGALAFWVVSLFTLNEKVSKKDLLILFFCAILGTTVNQLTFIEGLGMTSPIDAGLIVTMNPVMVMLISAGAKRTHYFQEGRRGADRGVWGSANHLAILHDKPGTRGVVDGQPALFY